MLAIDRLAKSLDGIKTRLLPPNRALASESLKKIQKTVESIVSNFGNLHAKPEADRICTALLKLRKQGLEALTPRDYYFLCWGLTERCDGLPPLIEEDELFLHFLDLLSRRPPSTLAWRGLLDAYFRYDPTRPGGQKLRVWLQRNLDSLWERTKPSLREVLDWLRVLKEERKLFSEEPCRPYAEEALRGQDQKINRLRSIIPEGSWFWQKLVLSQIEIASTWPDAKFKPTLDWLIEQLRQYETVSDEGLKALLIRYWHCQDRSPHERLKDFAVTQWGSPQLHRQVKWALVPEEVKAMVSQWLVLEDLEDFFLRLQADGRADRRRLDFWRRFLRQISYSRIVLGNSLWFSFDSDWKEFRAKKSTRISRLEGGGRKSAFIMKIGRYYFVEFSETGDACYGYSENLAPFSFESTSFRYPNDLKDKDKCVFWGSHTDGYRRWERKFLEELSNLGVYPDRLW